jgi:hypothetical protein
MLNISERYRLKALACEKLGRDVKNYDFKCAWAEIAVEWHALAARTAPGEIADILKSWPLKEIKQLVDEMEGKLRKPN